VLEEVSDAGHPQPFVRAPDMRNPSARDSRLIVPLDQQKPHSVRKRLFDDRDLLGRQRLRPMQ